MISKAFDLNSISDFYVVNKNYHFSKVIFLKIFFKLVKKIIKKLVGGK